MLRKAKTVLSSIGLYPAARSVYRSLSPSHQRDRELRRQFFAQLVKPGDLCFDIGANLGQTIEALRACRATVVAVEPNVLCLPTLDYHFRRDKAVTIVEKAVGSKPGKAELHFTGTDSTASLRSDWFLAGKQVATVEVVTLANLMDTYGVPRLLKVDVEGFEEEVFAGLDRPVPIVYFEMHSHEKATVERILSHLSGLGTLDLNAVSEDHSSWLLSGTVRYEEFLSKLPPVRMCNVVAWLSTTSP